MGSKKKISAVILNSKFKNLVIYIFLFFIAFLVYKPALTSYFFQDDWFTFKISTINSFKDFLLFFVPRTDVIYYRPLGMQLYFFVMRSIFGINPFYFRLSTLILYSLNGYLIYIIFKKLNFSSLVSFFSSVLYTGSVVTYIPFYWSSTFPFVLGPTFFLLSFYYYIVNSRSIGKYYAYLFYICGLLSLEIVIVLPLILSLWEIVYKKSLKIRNLILYYVFIIPYIILRLFIFPVKLSETYSVKISLLSTLRAYLFWSLNWPEEINRQFTGFLTLNSLFIKDFLPFIQIWATSSIIIIFIILTALFLKIRKFQINSEEIFGFLWFVISVIPLLLFSNHVFPYYLPVPLVGLLIFLSAQVSYLIRLSKNKYLSIGIIGIISCCWIINSLKTIEFNSLTYWAPRRAKQAFEVIANLNNYRISSYQYLIPIEYKYALNDQDGLQVILNYNLIYTIYDH